MRRIQFLTGEREIFFLSPVRNWICLIELSAFSQDRQLRRLLTLRNRCCSLASPWGRGVGERRDTSLNFGLGVPPLPFKLLLYFRIEKSDFYTLSKTKLQQTIPLFGPEEIRITMKHSGCNKACSLFSFYSEFCEVAIYDWNLRATVDNRAFFLRKARHFPDFQSRMSTLFSDQIGVKSKPLRTAHTRMSIEDNEESTPPTGWLPLVYLFFAIVRKRKDGT